VEIFSSNDILLIIFFHSLQNKSTTITGIQLSYCSIKFSQQKGLVKDVSLNIYECLRTVCHTLNFLGKLKFQFKINCGYFQLLILCTSYEFVLFMNLFYTLSVHSCG